MSSNTNKSISSSKEKSFFTRKSEAGKGDLPRKVGKNYYKNYEKIFGNRKSKYK